MYAQILGGKAPLLSMQVHLNTLISVVCQLFGSVSPKTRTIMHVKLSVTTPK